jgi:hypothetical protein
MRCHWAIIETNWRPCVRFGGTFTVCGSRVFLFGGYNKLALNDLQYLDLKKGAWSYIPVTKGKRPPERYGHTSLYYKNNLIIFGGE